MYRLRPAVIIVLGLILEPGFDRLRSGRWRRVPDPSCKFRDIFDPLIEGSLERSRETAKLFFWAPLRLAATGIVPDAGHTNYPESGDRYTTQGSEAIGFEVHLHVEIPVPAEDGHDAPVPFLDTRCELRFGHGRIK